MCRLGLQVYHRPAYFIVNNQNVHLSENRKNCNAKYNKIIEVQVMLKTLSHCNTERSCANNNNIKSSVIDGNSDFERSRERRTFRKSVMSCFGEFNWQRGREEIKSENFAVGYIFGRGK